VGEVGWSTRDEINGIDGAADGSIDNFGWPSYEGPSRQRGYDGANLTICRDLYGQRSATKLPFFSYRHGTPVISGDDCATTNDSSTAGLGFAAAPPPRMTTPSPSQHSRKMRIGHVPAERPACPSDSLAITPETSAPWA
jgi:hypothetical protein